MKRKRPAPLAGIRRVPVPMNEAMIETRPGMWTGSNVQAAEAAMLSGYLEALPEKLSHVLRDPAALPESRNFAEAALGDLDQAWRFVATLSAPQAGEVWNCMRLVLLAESVAVNELHAHAAQAGGEVILGGKKGADRQHGPVAERAARLETYRDRYAHYAAQFPEANHMKLLSMVAEDFDVHTDTIHRHVPNPKPTKRGRPKK